MNVNNNLQGLQQLLSSQEVVNTAAAGSKRTAAALPPGEGDQTTLSAAATLASQSGVDADVRMDKVAQVQAALASGAYNVPSADVAGKMMDQMLGK